MWLISSSPDELRRVGLLLAGAFLVSCGVSSFSMARAGASAAGDEVGPNSPLPPRKKAREVSRDPGVELAKFLKPMELKDFKVSKLEKTRDLTIQRLAGPRFLKTAKEPFMIEVSFKQPLDTRPRSSGPMIVLNGVKLTSTRMVPDKPDTLVAFLPDGASLKEENTLTVVWVGNQELIQPKEPFKFKAKAGKKD